MVRISGVDRFPQNLKCLVRQCGGADELLRSAHTRVEPMTSSSLNRRTPLRRSNSHYSAIA